jgi:proteic killer suppression protein
MLAFLEGMDSPDELLTFTAWKAHRLIGNRKGAWSLSVTANQRLTFGIDVVEREIRDVNMEDYH